MLLFLPSFIHLTFKMYGFVPQTGEVWACWFFSGEGIRSWLLTALFQWPFSRDCDLTLLKPLWQLFTHMENNICHDVTKPGILLPLHRALAELFFVTENRVTVSSSFIYIPPLPRAAVQCQTRCSFPLSWQSTWELLYTWEIWAAFSCGVW